MAKTNKTNTASTYAPLPRQEGESLFKHTFTNLRTNAENAGWNLYDPRMSAFVSFVTSDNFLTSFTSHGGNADDAMQFGLTGHQKRLEMADVGQDLTTSDSLAKNIFSALEADDEAGVDALITQSVETPVVAVEADHDTPSVVAPSPYTAEQVATFWNGYTNIAASIEDSGKGNVYDYNRELVTYIQADPRYLAFHQAYVDNNPDLSVEQKENLQAKAVQTHEDSIKTLDETAGFSTNLYANAQDFYFGIEQNYAPKPSALAPVFDAAVADRVLGTELTKAPDVPVITITQPSAPDILPEQIDKSQFNAGILEERARAEAAKLADIPSDVIPVADKTTPDAPKPEKPASTSYDIQKGDTLSQIVADHYGLTKWADIHSVYETVARNNGIADPDKIYAGNKLVLFDDPTVDLFTKEAKADKGITVAKAFNPAAEGIETSAPANSPRPALRPEGLVANLG